MSRQLRIGGACLNQTPLDWMGNLSNILDSIRKARQQKIDILCLPELCLTGYGCEDWFLSDWIPQKAFQLLSDIVPATQDIAVTIGLPIHLDSKVYNTIAVIANKEVLGFYAKHNLFRTEKESRVDVFAPFVFELRLSPLDTSKRIFEAPQPMPLVS